MTKGGEQGCFQRAERIRSHHVHYRRFNRKIAQEYDKYAVGIKQSLERGTAL